MENTNTDDRIVILATGERLPLGVVCRHLGVLASYLEDTEQDWHYLPLLRRVCFGLPVDPEQRRALARERLTEPDGTVDAALLAVVRAAVRGEGEHLRLESPFTDPVDRAMADYRRAQTYLRGHLDDPDTFLTADPTRDAEHRYRESTKPPPTGGWADREGDRGDQAPDGLPPR